MSSDVILDLQTIVVRSPDQLSGDLDGEVILLSTENGKYYNMNEVGSRIWTLLETPMSVSALVDLLTAEFDIGHAACEREALEFLAQLLKDKLLRIEGVQS